MDDETRMAFQAVLAKLTEHDGRFDAHDVRFDVFDDRFDVLDDRFNALDDRFDVLDDRFNALDDRFNALERKVDAQGVMLRTEILAVGQMVAANTESIALLRRDVDDLRSRL